MANRSAIRSESGDRSFAVQEYRGRLHGSGAKAVISIAGQIAP
jgi:hypothetical protein